MATNARSPFDSHALAAVAVFVNSALTGCISTSMRSESLSTSLTVAPKTTTI